MKRWNKFTIVSVIFVVCLVVVDQILKIWIKSNMQLGEMNPVFGNWFYLYFVENEGMAFGISFGAKFGKVLLTLLRIVVVSFLIYYVLKLIKEKKMDWIILLSFSLIIAGAIGNIVDCLFYGVVYDYAPFMQGNVVDMFYFQLFKMPEWLPLWGGHYFFPAIFNIADSCVTVGVFLVIIFNKRFFSTENKISDSESNDITSPPQE